MAAKCPLAAFMLALLAFSASCAGAPIQRVALLAPFEGRYREVGYDAYYAAQLAMQDFGRPTVELLAVDDGGETASAIQRARALASDPLVKIVVALGYAATAAETQAALAEVPVIIVGNWGARPLSSSAFMLSNPEIAARITAPHDVTEAATSAAPLVGSEMLALEQFRKLRANLMGIEIVSSASPADAAFRQRFLASGLYAPEPGLLATLNYDAIALALQAIQSEDTAAALRQIEHQGLNGVIRFQDGYWLGAPLHIYRYTTNGELEAIR